MSLRHTLVKSYYFFRPLVQSYYGKVTLRDVWKRELGWKGLSLINYWIFHDTPMNFHSMTQIIIHPKKKKKTQIIKISCLKSVE